jgi:hypothetical protein
MIMLYSAKIPLRGRTQGEAAKSNKGFVSPPSGWILEAQNAQTSSLSTMNEGIFSVAMPLSKENDDL